MEPVHSPAIVSPAGPEGPVGRTADEAARVLARDGPNALPPPMRRSPWQQLAAELVHFFALMLWAAAVLAAVAGMPALAIAIAGVVVVNVTGSPLFGSFSGPSDTDWYVLTLDHPGTLNLSYGSGQAAAPWVGVSVFDAGGKLLGSWSPEGGQSVQLNDLAAGSYYLSLAPQDGHWAPGQYSLAYSEFTPPGASSAS